MSIVAAYAVPHPPLIVPSVGRGEERGIQATIDAYREVARRIAAHEPDTIIVSSPHAPAYLDAFAIASGNSIHGDLRQFRSRDAMECRLDRQLASAVEAAADDAGIMVSSRAWGSAPIDHATFVPLHFVNERYDAYRLVVVGLSGLDAHEHRTLGQVIAREADCLGRRAVYIASGDLSHKLKDNGPYGFAPEGPMFDRLVTQAFSDNDLEAIFHFDHDLVERAAECGLRSFQIMAGALDGVSHEGELLSYEGPLGVGYAVAAFEVDAAEGTGAGVAGRDVAQGDAPDCEGAAGGQDPYVALARESFTAYTLRHERISVPSGLPAEMTQHRAGVFVSLHIGDDLRGCIGTLAPTRGSIAEEVICNAIAACSEDPRFPPVEADELPRIECSVDVLGEPEDIDGPGQLDVKRYGVIVSRGWRRGVLLPDLDGVDTVKQQIAIAKQKAGIPPSESCKLQRFEVVRHK